MNEKKHAPKKKKIIIIIIIATVAVVTVAVGVWYVADKARKETAAIEEKRENAKKEFTELNVEGDADRAAKYLMLVDDGRKDEALELYMNEVDEVDDREDKLSLLIELGNVSMSKVIYDHAVVAAEKRVEIDPTIESYQYLSIMHSSNNDFDGAIKAYEQLIELFDNEHPSTELTDDLRQQREVYVMELSNLKNVKELSKTTGQPIE